MNIMKSLTTKFFTIALAIVLSCGVSIAQPRIGGTITFVRAGNDVTATVSINAVNGADYIFGPATLQFTYNNTSLAYPDTPTAGTDYAYSAFLGPIYTQKTVTRPAADKISLNIFIDPGLGFTGQTLTAAPTPLVDINFTLGPQAPANFAPRPADFVWVTCEHSGLTGITPCDDNDADPNNDCVLFVGDDDCSEMANNALPVELATLEAQAGPRSVTLNWETASETDNAGFYVEYARTGEDFQQAAFVEGYGTTTDAQQYSINITDLVPGHYQFRLKQVDFDGSFDYSQTVDATVSVVGKYQLDNAYPNPFNPQTTINFAVAKTQNVQMQLYDTTGRLVMTLFDGISVENETQTVRVDGSTLTSGMYIARLIGENFQATQKLMLVK